MPVPDMPQPSQTAAGAGGAGTGQNNNAAVGGSNVLPAATPTAQFN